MKGLILLHQLQQFLLASRGELEIAKEEVGELRHVVQALGESLVGLVGDESKKAGGHQETEPVASKGEEIGGGGAEIFGLVGAGKQRRRWRRSPSGTQLDGVEGMDAHVNHSDGDQLGDGCILVTE